VTAPNPQSSTTETTDGPSSTAPTSGPGTEPWRAGQHSRFAGRSAEEILGIAETLASVAEKFNQPVAQPQTPAPNRFDLDIPDDDYMTGKQVKGILHHLANQPTPFDPVARQAAAGALYATIKLQWPEEFRKWEGEIRQEASKLPIEYWNLDNLTQIVRIVRSNHVDEIAAEKAQRLANESHPTIRSGSGGSGGVSTNHPFETGPADMLARLKAVGIQSEAELREACKGTGIEPEQYLAELEKYGKGAVIRG
jgi:hypothetical protein